MDQSDKGYILNKGLILGTVLIFFPIINLMFGMRMGWISAALIFGVFWIVIYTFLVVKWARKYASNYEVFPFRDAFRSLFVISAIGFGILTVGKIAIWNISYEHKYIDLQSHYYQDLFDDLYDLNKENYDELLSEGKITADKHESQIKKLEEDNEKSKIELEIDIQKWKNEGLGSTFFIGRLVYRLFFFAVYCAILALFVRKKQKFIKTN